MTRLPVLALIALLASAPLTLSAADASAQDRGGRDRDRREQVRPDRERPREQPRASAPSVDAGDVVRRVSSGRDGRMLGVRPRGGGYVVRWEYPGGRVADISVDGRTGRVTGER